MKTSELDYELPPGLIAQRPLDRRDDSRLLVYERAGREVRHGRFRDLPAELPAGALVVVNDTRVLPARLRLFWAGGGAAGGSPARAVGGGWGGAPRPPDPPSSPRHAARARGDRRAPRRRSL